MDDDKAERIRQTREREADRVTSGRSGRLTDTFDVDVVGVSFVPGYPDNLLALEALQFDAQTFGEPLAVIIRRNPQNPYDANACEVHVPALGDNGMVGHLTRPIAARLAPEIDRGQNWSGHVTYVRINPEHMDRPGLTVHLERSHNG